MFSFYPLVLMGLVCYEKPNKVVKESSNKLILIDIFIYQAMR